MEAGMRSPRATGKSPAKRGVSAGMASRLAMFGDQRPPDSITRKKASPRASSPRRSVSPRLQARVNSFDDVRADAPIVRGVNDRPGGAKRKPPTWGPKPPLQGASTHPGAQALLADPAPKPTGMALSLPKLQITTPLPAAPAFSSSEAAGPGNVDLQRAWLEQQLEMFTDRGGNLDDESEVSTHRSQRQSKPGSPVRHAQPAPMDAAASSVQAGYRGMVSRRESTRRREEQEQQQEEAARAAQAAEAEAARDAAECARREAEAHAAAQAAAAAEATEAAAAAERARSERMAPAAAAEAATERARAVALASPDGASSVVAPSPSLLPPAGGGMLFEKGTLSSQTNGSRGRKAPPRPASSTSTNTSSSSASSSGSIGGASKVASPRAAAAAAAMAALERAATRQPSVPRVPLEQLVPLPLPLRTQPPELHAGLTFDAQTGYGSPLHSARPQLDVTFTIQLPTLEQIWQRLVHRGSSEGVDHTAREHEYDLVQLLKSARRTALRRKKDAIDIVAWRRASGRAGSASTASNAAGTEGYAQPPLKATGSPPDFYPDGDVSITREWRRFVRLRARGFEANRKGETRDALKLLTEAALLYPSCAMLLSVANMHLKLGHPTLSVSDTWHPPWAIPPALGLPPSR